MKLVLTFIILNLSFFMVNAQNMGWKQHEKLGDKFHKAKNYGDAAMHYEKAWKQKTGKKDLIRKAAECYYNVKNYQKAAEAYKFIREDIDDPLTGLNFGRSLKQSGQYEEANAALLYFLNAYQGEDKAVVSMLVQNEIKGCEMGSELLNSQPGDALEIRHLNENINSNEMEFAPIPYSDDIFYFSSTIAGKSRIYRSQLIDGGWTKAVNPESFPRIPGKHFCNGSFSPDAQRFYFTLCEDIVDQGINDDNCAIYVTRRTADDWLEPEILREYVNMPETSNSHPYVFHKDGKEFLFYASNRRGGKGGMDIWYMSRRLDSSDIDFTLPKNAGDINTMGDEITPFYDSSVDVLYFSSNGQVSMGGFDIYSAKATEMVFSGVEHMGLPYNSIADDYFFRKTDTGTQSFLASNRLFGMAKISTEHDDIFTIQSADDQLLLSGKVTDDASALLNNANIELYEINSSGEERLLQSVVAQNGSYKFALLTDKDYSVLIYKSGFRDEVFRFRTEEGRFFYKNDFTLVPIQKEVPSVEPIFKPEQTPPNAKIVSVSTPAAPVQQKVEPETVPVIVNHTPKPEETRYSETSTPESGSITYVPAGEKYAVTSDAPRRSGTVYKVQVIAVKSFSVNHKRYRKIRNLARLDTERINDRNLIRVLLADYYTKNDALDMMDKVRKYPEFEKAFIVKYVDGKRVANSL